MVLVIIAIIVVIVLILVISRCQPRARDAPGAFWGALQHPCRGTPSPCRCFLVILAISLAISNGHRRNHHCHLYCNVARLI